MARDLTLPQKVFVVKNYYQITDMFQVKMAFQKSYKINLDDENILEIFFKLVTQFEMTGSVTQVVSIPTGGKQSRKLTPEKSTVSKRGRRSRQIEWKCEEQVEYLPVTVKEDSDADPIAADEVYTEEYEESQHGSMPITVSESEIIITNHSDEENPEIFVEGEECKDNPDDEEEMDCVNVYVNVEPVEEVITEEEPSIDGEIEEETADEEDEESDPPIKVAKNSKTKTKSKTKLRKKDLICECCGKVLTTLSALKVHRRTHTGEKPIQCKDCGESFSHYTGLSIHTKNKHSTGAYKCSQCDESFVYKQELLVSKNKLN